MFSGMNELKYYKNFDKMRNLIISIFNQFEQIVAKKSFLQLNTLN